MAHVLLAGDLMSDDVLVRLLRSWGLTLGAAPPGPTVRRPSVWECDAVIADQSWAESAAAAEQPEHDPVSAPLIVLGGPCPAATAVIGDVGSEGGVLLGALQTGLAQASCLRGQVETSFVLETDPLRVLGHEMRTPLTAIKTALEVLAAEMGELDPDHHTGHPQHRMIELAMRNVRRLQQTIDWSQTLLSHTEASAANRRHLPWPDLLTVLSECAPVLVAPATEPLPVLTNPALLAGLVGRLVQACIQCLPGTPVRICLSRPPSVPEDLILAVSPTDGAADHPSPTGGSALTEPPAADRTAATDLLAGLARVSLPAECLEALAAEFSLEQTPAGDPLLVLRLRSVSSLEPVLTR